MIPFGADGLSIGQANNIYLRLDCANDPLTATLEIASAIALHAGTAGAANFQSVNGITLQNAAGTGSVFRLTGDGANTQFQPFRYSNDATNAAITFGKGRGSVAAPAGINNGDVLGSINFQGIDSGGAFRNSGGFSITALEAFAPAAFGSRWDLALVAVGAAALTFLLRAEVNTGLSMYGANVVIDQDRVFRNRIWTVGTLPASILGKRTMVNDALAPAFGAAVAGGGAVVTPVFSTAAVWNVG